LLHSRARLPLIPLAPFSHKGRRGILGILIPETKDGTQGLPQKPTPVSCMARVRGRLPACIQECDPITGASAPSLGTRASARMHTGV
jgi:hypothetical protein